MRYNILVCPSPRRPSGSQPDSSSKGPELIFKSDARRSQQFSIRPRWCGTIPPGPFSNRSDTLRRPHSMRFATESTPGMSCRTDHAGQSLPIPFPENPQNIAYLPGPFPDGEIAPSRVRETAYLDSTCRPWRDPVRPAEFHIFQCPRPCYREKTDCLEETDRPGCGRSYGVWSL